LVRETLEIAIKTAECLQIDHPTTFEALSNSFKEGPFLPEFQEMLDYLYVPQPNPDHLLIEQFDRYFKLEEVTMSELKSRVLNKHEYWGGGNGLATSTKILKQADVVLMLNLFKHSFSKEVKKANWEYYEPRTEHGSSLSPCVYALVAADIGAPGWGYPYFMRTATIDLTGESKQYVGDLYIGGTHPAANGGAWMAAILGFAGLYFNGEDVHLNPSMPKQWKSMDLPVVMRGGSYRLHINRDEITIHAADHNTDALTFVVSGGQGEVSHPATQLKIRYS